MGRERKEKLLNVMQLWNKQMSGMRKRKESVMTQKFLPVVIAAFPGEKRGVGMGCQRPCQESEGARAFHCGSAVGHSGWELGTGGPDLDVGLVNLDVGGVQSENITDLRRVVDGERGR